MDTNGYFLFYHFHSTRRWVKLYFDSAEYSSTKYTRYELVFGFLPTLPNSIIQEPRFKYTYDDYIEDLKLKLSTSHSHAIQNFTKSKEINKKYYDKDIKHEEYKIGDLVYLINETNTPSTCRKLNPTYKGKFEIISIDSPVNLTIKEKRRNLKVRTNRIKRAYVSEHSWKQMSYTTYTCFKDLPASIMKI